jgi:threonine dehydrogenase-like Zn-dependent dehydrogenase
VLGHEIAGEIVDVGRLIEGYRVGMRVTATPNIGCGLCEFCRDGFNNMCPNYEAFGISIDGGFEEYMRVPHIAIRGGNIFPIPDEVDYRAAALIEPFSCVYNALRSVRTTHNDTVLVIGAGPIGAMHVLLNRIAGAKKILLADIRQGRLDQAKPFGADVVITAVSVPDIQAQAIELLATHGRVNFFGGLGKNTLVPIDTNRVHYKGLTLVGTTGSTNSDYYKCLTLVAEGRADLARLVTKTFSLGEIQDAFAYAASGEGLKAMVLS